MLDLACPAAIIDKLKSHRSIKIFISEMPASFCTARILTSILHKELIRFEVDFQPESPRHYSDLDLHIFVDLDPGECPNFLVLRGRSDSSICGALFPCECEPAWTHSCMLSYSLAKAMNYITSDVLWPMIVCFGFYKVFVRSTAFADGNDDDNPLSTVCNGCRDLHEDLVIEVQRVGLLTDVDGIYYAPRPGISFLNFTTLFSALQNDIPFILDKKIHCRKDKRVEGHRIHEYLARKGISREVSCEQYRNIGYSTRRLLESHFPTRKCFVKKIGHETEVSPVENFFLVCHHLLQGSRVDAFLSLSSKEVPGVRESIQAHHELIMAYRDCAANAQRLGHAILFKINASDALKRMSVRVMLHLYEHYFGMLMRKRYKESHRQVIVLEGYFQDKVVVATDDAYIASVLSDAKERIGGYAVVGRKELCRVVEGLRERAAGASCARG